MALTVTKPMATVTGISAALQSGGSLAASTTYYFVVVAYSETAFTAGNSSRIPFVSDISAEGTFTTDVTNLSALINWTNVTGAVRYQIFLTTTSGDYTNSKGYTTTSESTGTITDGVAGYTVTDLGSNNYAMHTCQLVNPLVNGIDKNLGNITIDFDGYNGGSGTTSLDAIYTAIVSAGYGSYVYYDGYNFTLKGWFLTTGTGSGNFYVYSRSLIFMTGGISCKNPNQNIQFGSLAAYGAVETYQCNVDVHGYRYPFYSIYENTLRFYGGSLTSGKSRSTILTENRSTVYLMYGGALAYKITLSEVNLYFPFRGVTSDIKDMSCYFSNNMPSTNQFRTKWKSISRLPDTYGTVGLYRATAPVVGTTSSSLRQYMPASHNFVTYYTTNLYNCKFPQFADNIPYFTFMTSYGTLDGGTHSEHHFGISFQIIDDNGSPVDGVSVDIKDQFGNPAVWVEHDGTDDEKVTGTKYTTARTTDANGIIKDFYLYSYRVNVAPGNTIASPYCDNIEITKYYPFTITLSKTGYQDYSIILEELQEETKLIIKYEPTVAMYIKTAIGKDLVESQIKLKT